MRRFGTALFVALICWPAYGQSPEPVRRQPFTPGPPVQLPQCTCRAEGRDWTVGQTICLRTTGGERLAICTTDENVTTWRISDVPCASSSLPSRSRLALIGRNLR